jgi:tripartite-type tricarboxylate transporter receptor subunit TctC
MFSGPMCLAAYPTHSINLVVPYGPGTGSDLLGRVVAQYMGQILGRTVVVQNKPGATGAIGTEYVVKAAPDGYTLAVGTNATLISTPILYPTMAYNPTVDLTPIGLIGRTAMVLVTRMKQPAATTLPELVAQLRAGPGTYGSPGIATVGDVISRIMLGAVHAEGTLVPYKGSGDSLVALIQGDTTFVIDSPSAVLPLVGSGLLRPIAVTGSDRIPQLPDTPTFDQLGVAQMDSVYAWFAVMAPAKLPTEIESVLDDAMARLSADPAFVAKVKDIGVEPVSMQGARLKAFVGEQYQSYGGFIRNSGIKLGQ